jgi:hypothetical protein
LTGLDGQSLFDLDNSTEIVVAPISLRSVVKNGENGEYLGIPGWCFVVGQAADDDSFVTGGTS